MTPNKTHTVAGQENSTQSSGQDGGIGKNPSLTCTTKRRTITNLKSINNPKCQKIKLHGTQTIKELRLGEDGGNIGGSGIHFPSAPGKYLADLRSRANSQQYSSIYED